MKPGPSRRTQIFRGIATPPEGAKSAVQDRRREPRQLPPVGMGRPLIGERPSLAVNVSRTGLAVRTSLSLGVGDSVPVKFAGFPVKGARIAWAADGFVSLATAAGD
jgi:hypothetical protein